MKNSQLSQLGSVQERWRVVFLMWKGAVRPVRTINNSWSPASVSSSCSEGTVNVFPLRRWSSSSCSRNDGAKNQVWEVMVAWRWGLLQQRRGVAACLVVLLHYDLPVKHPSSLPQHVEVELRKHWWNKKKTTHLSGCQLIRLHVQINLLTWDVGQHDDNEAVVVVERHIIQVRESNGVHPSSAYEWQSRVNGHQLSGDSQRVKDDEKVVSAGGKLHDFFQEVLKITCCVLKQTGLDAKTHARTLHLDASLGFVHKICI